MGKKTCIIESTYLGGTCLNVGCIPTKALIQTADVYHKVKDAARFAVTGVEADKIAVDMAALQARKKAVVKTLVNGVKGLLRGNKVTVVEGMASFADTHTLSVDGRSITGANIIIATGSSVFMPPFIAVEGENRLLTSTEALELDEVARLRCRHRRRGYRSGVCLPAESVGQQGHRAGADGCISCPWWIRRSPPWRRNVWRREG